MKKILILITLLLSFSAIGISKETNFTNEIFEKSQLKVLPITEKFYNFWMLKKRRFFYLFMLGWIYKYDWPNRI